MTDPAEIRAEGRQMVADEDTSVVELGMWLVDYADVLLADPAPVGLPEAEARALRWCATHRHPAWEYDDGSVCCMYDLIVETGNDHVLGARLVPVSPSVDPEEEP